MAAQQYSRSYNRSEQMKRELIGLVIGAGLLMAGVAFLFSQAISADTPPAASAKMPSPDEMPASLSQPLAVSPPPPPAINHPDSAVALATLDVAADNTAVSATAASVEETPTAGVSGSNLQANGNVQANDVSTPEPGRTGWIYAGQYVDGKWSEKGLQMGTELPVSGSQYVLTWGATVRDSPPGKSNSGGKLGKTIGDLAIGKQVEIVQVKKSGSKGHVWLEVKM